MVIRGEAGIPGLYDPALDHDSCGIGFVADIKGRASHQIIEQGLTVLTNLTHRGAVGADPLAGDGAGMLVQISDGFFRAEAVGLGIDLPPPGEYGVGMVFLPRDEAGRVLAEAAIGEVIAEEGLTLLGWRDVPVDPSCLGESVKPIEPVIRQFFVGWGDRITDADSFERKLFVVRKQAHHLIRGKTPDAVDNGEYYIPSLSGRTITYKGMVLAENLAVYYRDLADTRMESALALIHQRFSTNTFPSWALAQPFRYLCHNGEINTLRGNVNWMRARRRNMSSEILGDDLEKLWPLIGDNDSDSATFDNALELLLAGGYSLGHAMMLMIPEAWADNPLMDPARRDFYEYHAAVMEPWDGPAAVAFTESFGIAVLISNAVALLGAVLVAVYMPPTHLELEEDDEMLTSDVVTGGRHVAFPVQLQPGVNNIAVSAQSAGVTPPLVAEITISNVTAGSAVQLTRGLNAGEQQTFTITAP